ncbi:MerR family transcriptional regulator [Streptomyces catenulae]|uniref:MerR family transcriptional regulator n=1 Tax=Streptomyces catenulae TaxID=66875 RepID=A0ABV2Z362_9ACTN|nr:MerR family transcriptional regulator [Streptomyces catenulae]
MTELAAEAGITVRTLRFYRERKLIPPPRREGRIAWYNEHHLARLRSIAALLERGHTLGGITELLAAFESGRDVGELLGLDTAFTTPWSDETPVRLTPEELADHYSGDVTAENLAASLDIGYLAVDGDEFVHTSRRLLDASTTLVARGIPLAAVLEAGRAVRTHADAVAAIAATLFRTHLIDPPTGAPPAAREIDHLSGTLEELHPVFQTVIDAEITMAMDRRVRAELECWMRGERPDGDAERADGGGCTQGGGGA